MSQNRLQEMSLEKPLTWSQITHLVGTYQLEKLGRSQSQLKSYHDFKKMMAEKGVSLTTNLMINTMHWLPADTDIHLSSEDALKRIKYKDARPFANPEDVYISINEFPYYIKERTIHLLVWVKSPMLPDPQSDIGDIDDAMKETIEKYVMATFVRKLGVPRDHLVWWKNYAKIQSIRTIPHIHILINLEDDVDGLLEKKVKAIIGTPGVMLDYGEMQESKL